MLWSPAILLLLAGAALASPQNGYEDGKEYIYKVRSRTMAEFDRESKQYSGILIEARLVLQRTSPDTLRAKITQPRYAQIHTRLEHGWDSEIPQNQKNLQSLPLSGEPIEIRIKNGAVRELVVDKKTPTWEVNIIKGMVSQLQVDLRGENALKSKHNQMPEGDQPTALFKTMEDTVGGKCEVLYDVSPLPESARQNKPELVPMPRLREDGEFISVVKTKNYSNCEQRMTYHFGVDGENKGVPDKNENGKYLSRSSVSQIVISGKPKKFIVQSSITTNKVIHTAGKENHQEGMIASKMNLTLNEVKDASESIPSPSNPHSAGNLVYNFNDPLSENSRRSTENSDSRKSRRSRDSEESNESSSSSESSESREEREEEENQYQPKPKLTEAPKIPLLPLFIGNRGKSIQKSDKVDVTKSAKDIAKQIGNELQKPDSMPEEKTLEKFILLTRLIRTMDAEQIAELQRELYEPRESANQLNPDNKSQNARRTAWVALRDAMAQAGTGPALVNIKQLITNKKIKGDEAADVIDATAKSARTPTPEYLEAFFNMATAKETKEEPAVRDAAIQSFANLLRHAVVNKRTAHNRYPVHTFGKFAPKDQKDLHEKYIPYLAEELKKAIDEGKSEKVTAYTDALGKTGHPRILSVLEPYLEGKKSVSPFQRLVMVLSLRSLAEVKPKLARGILYKVYANKADHHEIRTAAVYLLMGTQPPASMLQRMAEATNFDSNKQVNSAVKSSIESLSELKGEENRNIANAAKAARPLLTSETYGPQQSRSMKYDTKDSLTESGLSLLANYIGSDDSIMPKGIYVSTKPSRDGLKEGRDEFGIVVSSVKDLMNFVNKKLNKKNEESDDKDQQKKSSPEHLARLLGIDGDDPKQIEGILTMNGKYGNKLVTFDNHTLEKVSDKLKQLAEELKNGKNYEDTKLNNYEVTISFPTETGLPLYFAVDVPKVMSISGRTKLSTEPDEEKGSKIPKSATVSGKLQIVYGMEVQKRMGFVAPFESQEYVSGLNKNLQIVLPLRGEVSYDKTKKEVRAKVQPDTEEKENKLVQYKEKPFTSKHDILNLEPLSKDKNTHPIKKEETRDSEIEISDENDKPTLKIEMTKSEKSPKENEKSESKPKKAYKALEKLAEAASSLYSAKPRKAEYQKYTVKMNPKNDMSVEIKASHSSKGNEREDKSEESEDESPKAKAPKLEDDLSGKDRKEKLLEEALKNIRSAEADAVDISVKVNGASQPSARLTAAIGRSNVDKKSRALFYASAKTKDGKKYHASAGFEAKNPKDESLDYEETLKENKPREFDAEIRVGKSRDENSEDKETKFKIRGSAQQSENRKEQVRQSREAQECSKHKEQTGDKMTSACEKANQKAASLDSGEITVTSEDEAALQSAALTLLDAVEALTKNNAETSKNRLEKEEKNKIKISFEMSPSNEKVDVTFKTPAGKLDVKNAELSRNSHESNGKIKDIRNKKNQDLSMQQDNECYLDKTKVKTFDNHRYSAKLGKCWHVAMTTYPKNDPESPTKRENIPKNSRVSILAKETEDGKKELKITLGEKEIKLSPSESQRAEVKVDDRKIDLSPKKSHQEKKDGRVVAEIFELKDKSIKLVSDKYDIKVVYDGSRAKIETGDRYRASVRGLCGNKDGEPEDDQQTPRGCLLQKPEEFASTYALTNDEKCEGPARQNAEKAKKSDCASRTIRPGNVISEREAGRKGEKDNSREEDDDQERRCTRHRTLVTKDSNEICFSLRPVPRCSSKCSSTGTKSKNIQFHCVARSSASEKIAKRVEDGANPDLSQKKPSKSENLEVPISCKP